MRYKRRRKYEGFWSIYEGSPASGFQPLGRSCDTGVGDCGCMARSGRAHGEWEDIFSVHHNRPLPASFALHVAPWSR